MTQVWSSDEFYQVLEQRLDEVMRGQVLLQHLPPAVQAWFFAGEAYGRASRQPEVDALERETNRLGYYAFMSPGERRDMLLNRLNQALTTASPEEWDRIEATLRNIATGETKSEHLKEAA